MERLFPIVYDNFPPDIMSLNFSINTEPLESIEIHKPLFL
jgi:hypothetical protein